MRLHSSLIAHKENRMRKYIIFMISILALFLITCSYNVKECKNNTKPINSGFVFIDGKYIKAPYCIETRDHAIYINGLLLMSKRSIINPYFFDHDPGIPPNVTKDMTLDESFSLKEPTRNIRYIAAKQWYLFSHFSYEEAYEKTITYFENLPNIKSLTKIPGHGWVIESYIGEKTKYIIWWF